MWMLYLRLAFSHCMPKTATPQIPSDRINKSLFGCQLNWIYLIFIAKYLRRTLVEHSMILETNSPFLYKMDLHCDPFLRALFTYLHMSMDRCAIVLSMEFIVAKLS